MSNIEFDYGTKTKEETIKSESGVVRRKTKDEGIIIQEEINKESKYGDDEMFESWADLNVFFPVGLKLVDPLYNLGLTPNMVTIMSTIFTFLSIYFLHQNMRAHASLSYLFGYMLDCVDGRMARKYSMGSDVGMALDCTSDNVSNALLFLYILLTRPFNWITGASLGVIAIMSFLLSLSYGLNEAIAAMKETGTDNFYERRFKQLEGRGCGYEKGLFNLFLFITKSSYETYKLFFPEYNEEQIFKWLKVLKHFGPGNYCLLIGIMLLYI
jgi:hypothetical protein